ncbi:dual specificity protein phosphatase family protein [Gemmata algarum]|uniref:protein-tyrosine phosphatase family protein n=1 Tax=Gemmata algarum TaxID=2975278 RepID=UPI002DD6A47E|nr:dual specificity protein phosphatase family protein [Gemmata algarum]
MYRITQCLSVGMFPRPEDAPRLLASGITHVLNVSDRPSDVSVADGFGDVAWVPMSDSRRLLPATALQALNALHELAAAPDAHVYVHCMVGRLRSPTILWLYLIALGLDPHTARDLIESRAPHATAGHYQMVSNEHVRLAQKHGRARFFPHPRSDLVMPFPLAEEE